MADRIKVLFVCMGNICRSPAAEAVFRKCVSMDKLEDHFDCDSCGTTGSHAGEKPDPRMVRAGKERGVKVAGRARKFDVTDFDDFHRIIVMDRYNHEDVSKLARSEADLSKVLMMAEFYGESDVTDVPDPYYGGQQGFDLVLDMLEISCRNLLTKLVADFGIGQRG